MAKKVDVTFKNPVDESFIDHLELWRKTEVGGTYAQIGSDFTFVTGTSNYTYEDLTANVDSTQYFYQARAYNNNGGEVEGADYNKIEANITISGGFLFEDDFAGTVIDVATKWTLVEGDPGDLDITQNEELISTQSNVGTAAFGTYLKGQTSHDITGVKSFTFDLEHEDNGNYWLIGLSKDATLSDNANAIWFQYSTAGTTVTCGVKTGGSADTTGITADLLTRRTMKIDIDGGNAIFSIWDGVDTWTVFATIAMGMTGNFYPFISWWNSTGSSLRTLLDNVVLTDALFTTQRP